MTSLTGGDYYPRMMKDWKHKGAFVVQFQPETDLETGRCEGRAEHIASYRAARFRSLEELLAFVAQILTETRAPEEQDHEEIA